MLGPLRFILLLFLLVDTRAVLARCDSTEACLKSIETAHAQTRSLQADFRQEKHLDLLDEPLISTGSFAFVRPDRVLLEVETPQPVTIVIDGSEIRIPGMSEDERRALAMSPLASTFAPLGAIFTGSLGALREKFEVSAGEEDGSVNVLMTARAARSNPAFRKIELHFRGAQRILRRIRIEDALGDHLEITLDHVQVNVDVPDELLRP